MSMRLMTYNILNGGEDREALILDVIRTADPDVIVFQEVFTVRLLKYLSHALGMNYYLGRGNRKRKVALLSRLPVLNFTSLHPLFPIWRNCIHAEIEVVPGKTVQILGVHPIANLGVVFEVLRSWEAAYITHYVRRFKNAPCLIAGDFNAIAPGETVRTGSLPGWLKWIIYLQGNRVYHFSIKTYLFAGFTDCFRFLNSNEGFTLPPPDPNARLDYIFVNATMLAYLNDCRVTREPASADLASDHYPVVAEFSFSGE